MERADLIIRAMFLMFKGKDRFDRALEAEFKAYCAWSDSRWAP